jgi:beta-lactam-binding protein with PASTA domain
MKGSTVIVAVIVSFGVIGCSGSNSKPSTVTVTAPTSGAITSSSVAATGPITLPEVAGKNAEIARSELEQLGLTNVELASANPKYSVVVLARNWTCVSIEPPAGTVVQAKDPVIVKVTKD